MYVLEYSSERFFIWCISSLSISPISRIFPFAFHHLDGFLQGILFTHIIAPNLWVELVGVLNEEGTSDRPTDKKTK